MKQTSDGSILIPKIAILENTGKSGKMGSTPNRKKIKQLFKFLKYFLIVLIILSVYLVIAGRSFIAKANELKLAGQELKKSVDEKNLQRVKENLVNIKSKTSELDKAYGKMAILKFVPFIRSYYRDGEHVFKASTYSFEATDILVSAIEPYADVIGFTGGSGNQAGSPEETTEERINFVIKTLSEIEPKADLLDEKMALVKNEIDQIDPDRYPEKFMGKPVKAYVEKGVGSVDLASQLLSKGRPLLKVLPDIVGVNGTKRYMIVFQNDKELRPTGGFITAYSIAKVYNGHFESVLSNDIYNLDSSYKPAIPAPDIFPKYLKGIYQSNNKFRLRDMNWSPDFETSMGVFFEEAKKVGIKDIDGIIAVDTQMLVNLLDVLGPIGVSGYGNFSTNIVPECKCPQVIYELESFADTEGPIVWSENEPGKIVFAPKNYDNRKKIIGPLMNSVLANTMGQPKNKLPDLFKAAMKSLLEKHVLFYLLDDEQEQAVKSFGIAGTLSAYEGDYIFINDANLGGRKSNLYVTQEVEQNYSVDKSGKIVKTVILTYKNPEKFDGWLNSVLPNWTRIYVPKGAKLISFDGVDDKKEPYEEFGKTVFSGGFNLRPQGIVKLTIKYELPFTKLKVLNFLIQKQPGTGSPRYIITSGGQKKEFFLAEDKELKLKI